MSSDLQLVVSRNFDGVIFDCYAEYGGVDPQDFWATRTQIGELLGYENPRDAIKDIHNRNKERLDRFSTQRKMRLHEETRTVTREVFLYNFKGLLEICRYSQQPNANKVIDMLWDIADEIRRTGSYNAKNTVINSSVQDGAINLEGAKLLQHMLEAPAVPLSEESKAVIQHEMFKLITGEECLAMLPAVTEKYYSATELGKIFGVSSKKIGKIAKANGLKSEEGKPSEFGQWRLSKSPYSAYQCSTFV